MSARALDSVAETVRAGRKRLGLTQSQLAARIGASAAAIAFWETSRARPGPRFRGPLAAVLGCNEESLRASGPAPRTPQKRRNAREITTWARIGASTADDRIELDVAQPTARARSWARRRSRESARLDALASEILRGEHGTGHRAGDRPDLCPTCAASAKPIARAAPRRDVAPGGEPRIARKGGRRR